MGIEIDKRVVPDRREGPRRAEEINGKTERQETIYELSDIIFVVQEMAKRLADETHGDAYGDVRELGQKLHEARLLIEKISQGSAWK